jgi:hypothetical protein
MADGNAEMILGCSNCGSNDLVGPEETTDESVLSCNSCGAELGTFNDILTKKFAKDLEGTLGETLEGFDNIKFTKSGD